MDERSSNFFPHPSWKHFEELFGAKFPFAKDAPLENLSWVQPYIDNTLKEAMSRSLQTSSTTAHSRPRSETFETLNHIIVKVFVPSKEKARQLRIYSGLHELRLEERNGRQKHSIPLPSPVLPKQCKAVYKDGMFLVHLRKEKAQEAYHEVNVRFLD